MIQTYTIHRVSYYYEKKFMFLISNKKNTFLQTRKFSSKRQTKLNLTWKYNSNSKTCLKVTLHASMRLQSDVFRNMPEQCATRFHLIASQAANSLLLLLLRLLWSFRSLAHFNVWKNLDCKYLGIKWNNMLSTKN